MQISAQKGHGRIQSVRGTDGLGPAVGLLAAAFMLALISGIAALIMLIF